MFRSLGKRQAQVLNRPQAHWARINRRSVVTQQAASREEGDISSVFRSLSGDGDDVLPQRFADVKRGLIKDRDVLHSSWVRLLGSLKYETEVVKEAGPSCIPQIDFSDISNPSQHFDRALRKRGVAVIRQVVPEAEARAYKTQAEEYIKANPSTKAFPPHDPQVYELYWSRPQWAARTHPNMMQTQRFLMSYYHSRKSLAECSTQQPLTYCDRLRIRQPGDAGFALGPHVDGGSVERWEEDGYRKGRVYDDVFEGQWEKFDPWELSTRLEANGDLYNGAGACTMFRMYQGWLSMSHTCPGEGTLLVNPLFSLSTAYYLLRPFFTPRLAPIIFSEESYTDDFLDPSNWEMEDDPTAALQGAWPGHGQELSHAWHPHLKLPHTMVHVPEIRPGDYVAWHCDTIHAVDKVHAGKGDSSVLYIPVCPTTKVNLDYLARQREHFLQGVPPPDFPGGAGERGHLGRPGEKDVREVADAVGLRAAGFEKFDVAMAKNKGEAKVLEYGNEVLGFA